MQECRRNFSLSVLLIFGMVCHLTIRIFLLYPGSGVALTLLIFLADRTNGRAIATLLRLSVVRL